MNRKKKYAAACFLASIVFMGYILPNMLNLLQDNKMNNAIEILDLEHMEFQAASNLSLEDKFFIMEEATSVVTLDSGQRLTFSQAKEAIWQDIDILFWEKDIVHPINELEIKDYHVRLFSSEKGVFLVWVFYLENPQGEQLEVWLDDEIGKVISLKYEFGQGADGEDWKGFIVGNESEM